MEYLNDTLRKRLPALALLIISVLFWTLYDRYEASGPTWLENPSLEQATAKRGDLSESEGGIRLHVPEKSKIARTRFLFNDPGLTQNRFIYLGRILIFKRHI